MNIYIIYLLHGFAAFMLFASWCIYAILKMAHDEDPGCLNPNHHPH